MQRTAYRDASTPLDTSLSKQLDKEAKGAGVGESITVEADSDLGPEDTNCIRKENPETNTALDT
jgi:hypothetical protein